jgi:ATPase subunit of ABC transporter with duplicated ATPase domains
LQTLTPGEEDAVTQSAILFNNVTFAHDEASFDLFDRLSLHCASGWTGVVGANGSGKTTLLRLACGQLTAATGTIRASDSVAYCPQRTDNPPAGLEELLEATDGLAMSLFGRLKLQADWARRWVTLSHGERKRAQIAVALWRQPQVLAVDEPTNHVDIEGRRLLLDALQSFTGVGLIVCHDRAILDDLCYQCLFLDPPQPTLRPGGYSRGREQAEAEQRSARRDASLARAEVKRLEREARRRSREVERSARRGSKRRLDRHDSDGRDKIDRARLTGKDGSAVRGQRRMFDRVARARARVESEPVTKTYELGIWLAGERARRDLLLRIPEGVVPLAPGRRLRFPELVMSPDDRVALIGANGAGKSSLLGHIVKSIDLPCERVVYLPQEVRADESQRLMEEVRKLDHDRLGRVMTTISCLGSRPQRLLKSCAPSPGEVRKLLLALGITANPYLIILDEPTNHLDLPSIECLEAALRDCPCGLLMVSHDLRFLQCLTRKRWQIKGDRLLEAGRYD